MSKQYFFSDDLSECAGCGCRMSLASGAGIIELTAPGKPTIAYCLCGGCAKKMQRGEFKQLVEDRVVARARFLGAFAQPASSLGTQGDGK